jgi:hypothetical protein
MHRRLFPPDLKPKYLLSVTFCILAALQVSLFVDHHKHRWDSMGNRENSLGEGLFICHNGLGYYAWLRSLLIDGDWSFDDEFDDHALTNDYVPPPSYRTPIGRRANQWSIGPACLWAVTVVPVHLVTKTLAPAIADGYSPPYQWTIGLTSLVASLAGLGFTFAVCRKVARPSRAALGVAWLWLGTTVIYYGATEVSSAHGLGAAAMAVLVWYWFTTYGSTRPARWLVVGLLIGAAALMRWQLLTFAALPGGELLLTRWQSDEATRPAAVGRAMMCSVLAALGGAAALFPQMLAWRCVYGAWIIAPLPGVVWNWSQPSLWQVLCSWDRSLFYWTPLALFVCLGAVWAAFPQAARPGRNRPFLILLFAFGLQVYVVASVLGRGPFLPHTGNWSGVHLAGCYGFRFLSESLIALAPGFVWSLERLPTRLFSVAAGLGGLLVMWNLQLIGQFEHGLLSLFAGASPKQLLGNSWVLLRREPGTFIAFAVLGPVLLTVLLSWAAAREETGAER